jgi:hypothetical protein
MVHAAWITDETRLYTKYFLSVRMNLISTCDTYVPRYKVIYKASLRKAVSRKCKKDSENGLNKYLQHWSVTEFILPLLFIMLTDKNFSR